LHSAYHSIGDVVLYFTCNPVQFATIKWLSMKRGRPLEKQDPFESRRLWKNVTDSLRESEIDKATEHKRTLEERQRTEERHRTETGTLWKTKYFIKEGDSWVYHKPLWKIIPTAQPAE